MSWIKRDKNDQEIKKVFSEVVHISKKYNAQKKEWFPIKPDNNVKSYYTCRQKRSLKPTDFEAIDCRSFNELKDRLTEHWTIHGDNDLVPLVPSMVKLAETLYDVQDQNAEISPYIYVMF